MGVFVLRTALTALEQYLPLRFAHGQILLSDGQYSQQYENTHVITSNYYYFDANTTISAPSIRRQ